MLFYIAYNDEAKSFYVTVDDTKSVLMGGEELVFNHEYEACDFCDDLNSSTQSVEFSDRFNRYIINS